MEEEKKLYPFRLSPVTEERAWGEEEWQLADLGYKDTPVRDGWLAGNALGEVMETYLDRVSGENVFDWYGLQFPFQIKEISVKGKMPLLVSPGDDTARERYDALGKEKLWYVLEAEADTRLLAGLRADVGAADFFDACKGDRAYNLLNSLELKAGDAFYIPSGAPHCISGKAKLLEISESSALDFVLSGGGEDLPENDFGISLGLADALDFVNLKKFVPERLSGSPLLRLPQFTCNFLKLEEPLNISAEGPVSSCISYTCIKGEVSVQLPVGEDEKIAYLVVKAGESVLVPAECDKFYLVPGGEGAALIETGVEPRSENDPYLKPVKETD